MTNGKCFSGALVLLRVVLGFEFLWAGVSKFGDWSAAGYLEGATGPFAEWFQSMAGSPVVDQLNIWGLTLVGIALILGVFVRPASFSGAALMLLYYFAQFEQNTAHGPVENHIVYVLVFILFMAGGVGHMLGLDGLIYRHAKKKTWLVKTLFG